jgi:hypothetical protein
MEERAFNSEGFSVQEAVSKVISEADGEITDEQLIDDVIPLVNQFEREQIKKQSIEKAIKAAKRNLTDKCTEVSPYQEDLFDREAYLAQAMATEKGSVVVGRATWQHHIIREQHQRANVEKAMHKYSVSSAVRDDLRPVMEGTDITTREAFEILRRGLEDENTA